MALFERYLRQLYVAAREGRRLEVYLAHLLWEVAMPQPGDEIVLNGPGAGLPLHRAADDSLPHFESGPSAATAALHLPDRPRRGRYSLRRLLVLLEPTIVLQLLACALLEQQVVLRSQDCELLTLVVGGRCCPAAGRSEACLTPNARPGREHRCPLAPF